MESQSEKPKAATLSFDIELISLFIIVRLDADSNRSLKHFSLFLRQVFRAYPLARAHTEFEHKNFFSPPPPSLA